MRKQNLKVTPPQHGEGIDQEEHTLHLFQAVLENVDLAVSFRITCPIK